MGSDDLGDHRVPDVSPDEVGTPQIRAWGDDIDSDHVVDRRQSREGAGDLSSECSGDSGDENYPAHDVVPVRLSGERSGSLAETATSDPRLLEELAVLLLRHALTALLDD
jgi:hypothetical protein